jgi:MATE family multidrug resistance protein
MVKRWAQAGGYKEVLKISGPMILSMGSWSLMHFVDRMFLTWYSRDALAAALPAGLLSFAFGSFFLGTASYVNTFVAQYFGAKRFERVGAAVWQGIYFSLFAGVLMVLLAPASEWIFELVGHEKNIRDQEIVYFEILTAWLWAVFLMAGLSAFFSGRGDTWTVLWVNVAAAVINIVLDYVWIFGYWGFSEKGIEGAAWATVVSQVLGCVAFLVLIFQKPYREQFHTLKGWRLDRVLLLRLWRFGAPSGLHFMIDILGFSMFVLLVGRLGAVELAATNLTFNINTLAFLPMLGLGIAVSTLVGQYLGDNQVELAEKCTYSALHLSLGYMLVMVLGYGLLPDVFLQPFASHSDPSTFQPVRDLAVVLLRFVAFYCLFDAAFIVFSSAVKGAGDTQFVMWMTLILSTAILVVPTYLAVAVFDWGIYATWFFISAYIAVMAIAFYLRFRSGKWKSMRVIEQEGISLIEGREAAQMQVREHTDVI